MNSQLPLQQLIDLKSKTAVVTGGAMGIGFGIAYRLAEAGANVVIADLNEEVGNTAVKELNDKGWKAVFVKTNVADEIMLALTRSFPSCRCRPLILKKYWPLISKVFFFSQNMWQK